MGPEEDIRNAVEISWNLCFIFIFYKDFVKKKHPGFKPLIISAITSVYLK